jgi:uncharacterized protein (DUF2141 family)
LPKSRVIPGTCTLTFSHADLLARRCSTCFDIHEGMQGFQAHTFSAMHKSATHKSATHKSATHESAMHKFSAMHMSATQE